MFNIEFSKTAQKQLYKLGKDIQIRIISTLGRIRVRPYPHVKKIVGSNFFRLRVGKYRVILDIQKNIMIIYVIEIGHRRNIHK
ncbi:MAG: type II toxin-antitoxin system RelE/ParE family toxin [Nanoarchaeota archaeon]|nr:type II toxin-antitoxin system RelE/ParE family toxin [Nanoarchaeota archaeon]